MGDGRSPTISRSVRRADRLVNLVAAGGRILDLPPDRRRWFTPLDPGVVQQPGARTPEPMHIPQADANRLLRGFIRFVADISADASLDLVWHDGASELWVDAGSVDLTCANGLLTVGVTVSCDEISGPVRVTVPFATGSADS